MKPSVASSLIFKSEKATSFSSLLTLSLCTFWLDWRFKTRWINNPSVWTGNETRWEERGLKFPRPRKVAPFTNFIFHQTFYSIVRWPIDEWKKRNANEKNKKCASETFHSMRDGWYTRGKKWNPPISLARYDDSIHFRCNFKWLNSVLKGLESLFHEKVIDLKRWIGVKLALKVSSWSSWTAQVAYFDDS